MSNVGELRSDFLGTAHKFRKRKKNSSSLVYILHEAKNQAFSRRSRAATATKCTKKAWCTCKIVVLVNKPIAFLSFSLQSPSQSSALKSTKKKSFLAKVKVGKVSTTSLRFVCRAPKWEGQANRQLRLIHAVEIPVSANQPSYED